MCQRSLPQKWSASALVGGAATRIDTSHDPDRVDA